MSKNHPTKPETTLSPKQLSTFAHSPACFRGSSVRGSCAMSSKGTRMSCRGFQALNVPFPPFVSS